MRESGPPSCIFGPRIPESRIPNPQSRRLMHCLFCQHADTRVIDSRVSEDGATIRRRREYEAYGERFSTLETIELKLPEIIKSDGRRATFDRSEGHKSELQSLMRISYAVFCLKKKNQ